MNIIITVVYIYVAKLININEMVMLKIWTIFLFIIKPTTMYYYE